MRGYLLCSSQSCLQQLGDMDGYGVGDRMKREHTIGLMVLVSRIRRKTKKSLYTLARMQNMLFISLSFDQSILVWSFLLTQSNVPV